MNSAALERELRAVQGQVRELSDALRRLEAEFQEQSDEWLELLPRIGSAEDWGVVRYPTFFDLEVVQPAMFRLWSNGARTAGAYVGGAPKTIGTVSPELSFGTDHWEPQAALSATSYLYLLLDRQAATATLRLETTYPTPTPSDPDTVWPYTELFPLWKLVWDSTNERIGRVEDWRGSVRVDGL